MTSPESSRVNERLMVLPVVPSQLKPMAGNIPTIRRNAGTIQPIWRWVMIAGFYDTFAYLAVAHAGFTFVARHHVLASGVLMSIAYTLMHISFDLLQGYCLNFIMIAWSVYSIQ